MLSVSLLPSGKVLVLYACIKINISNGTFCCPLRQTVIWNTARFICTVSTDYQPVIAEFAALELKGGERPLSFRTFFLV